MKPPQFSPALLHPKYWLTWLSLGLMALVAQLPYSWQIMMGRFLGWVAFYLARRRRHIAKCNIDLCFPEKSDTERYNLLREHFIGNGITLFEMGMAWFMPHSRLSKRFTIKGKEHWDALKEQGSGALIIGLHFNTLEIANFPVSQYFDLHTSYRAHNNAVFDFVQHRRRERNNQKSEAINRYDMRGMIRVLKKGDWLWYAPDQDYGRKVSEFVPWFGTPAATLAATPRLLKIAKVPAVGLTYKRLDNYQGYEIEFKPPLAGLPSGDDYQDLVTLNQYVEACVRANPSEYLWVHRRFKTRPKGLASVYQ